MQHRDGPGTRPGMLQSWAAALATVVATVAAMAATAALGLWLAQAGSLPAGAFGPVLAATVLMALGVPVDLVGGAGFLAQAAAGISALPLSVSLVGALVAGVCFLRPLRFRAAARGGELLGAVARTAVLWVAVVLLLAWQARHSFTISTGNSLSDQIGAAIGVTPTVGFQVSLPAAVGWGLLWLAIVLVLAFTVSHRAPLPNGLLRLRQSVQPAAGAMLALLLGYALLGVVAGVITALTRGDTRATFAVVCLAVPNLAWMALGIGLGGSWHGHLSGSIGLPMPKILSEVLQTSRSADTTLDLGSLAQRDGRVWWLPVVAAVLVLAACTVAAVRAHSRPRPWQYALRTGAALAVTLLLVGLASRISAAYGLSLLGVGDVSGLAGLLGGGGGSGGSGGGIPIGGSLYLQPDLLRTVALGALWGAVAGLLVGWVVQRRHRSADDDDQP
ncbi:streptophobe family protein [Streptacidiphilus sp. EB129]|uniref:streptophobe family protein n=1 Tax=Streptacidiphilus sp. EB129 TaxID=3156262 RepID=UPI003514869A